MWETPIYRINQGVRTDPDGKRIYKEVVIDVTRSAPSFAGPGKALAGALDEAVAVAGVGPRDTILDFGAGKLRNTIYLLEKGYRVCAVEFANQFDRSEPARKNLARAEDEFRRRFSRLVFPDAFEALAKDGSRGNPGHEAGPDSDQHERYKLILLINVINIMPVPAERNYVLTLCNQCLADGGRLLWYTQRGDGNYRKQRLKEEYRLGDGVYVGRTTYRKTFYREYDVKEIDELLRLAGFDYERKIEATWRNQSRLYKKTGSAVLAEVLDPEIIDRARVSDDSIPDPKAVKAKEPGRAREKYEPREVVSSGEKRKGQANPPKLTDEVKLIETLKAHAEGDGHADSYLELIRVLFERLFADALHKFNSIRLPADAKLYDLVAFNKSKGGFFSSLKPEYDLVSRRIVMRCRNRRHTKHDPAFSGLTGGMDHNLGFGFLTYRRGDRRYVLERCRKIFLVDEKLILPLDDNDLADLLRSKMKVTRPSIDDLLRQRVREVAIPVKVFVSYSRADKNMMEEIEKALSTLKKRRAIDPWIDKSKLRGGDAWQQKIATAVSEAQVAIFLVSNDSLASDFIDPHEVDPLLEAQSTRGVSIVPVNLGAADIPGKLKGLNFVNGQKPVYGERKGKRLKIWHELVQEIKKAFVKVV